MSVLIYAEHDNHTLKPATLSVVNAAKQLDDDIHLLVAGSGCDKVADSAKQIEGVTKVLYADHDVYANQLAEPVAALVLSVANNYCYLMAGATTTGKNLLPRVAALLDVGMVSDVTAVLDKNTFIRPIYAGNASETVQVSYDTIVLSVRATAFDKAAVTGGNAQIVTLDAVHHFEASRFKEEQLATSARPELTAARVVVSGGRALASGDNFANYLEPLADKLGAAIGASRAAVDAGFVPNDLQVGQTGKIVAPDLYIAVGISGAIQHMAGIKDAKTIVAINNDPDSPIAKVADYYLEGDLFQVLPELTAKL